jgi:hypothetical protein
MKSRFSTLRRSCRAGLVGLAALPMAAIAAEPPRVETFEAQPLQSQVQRLQEAARVTLERAQARDR